MMKRISLLLAAVLLLSLLTGCGDSGAPRESTVGTTAPVPTDPLPTLPPETTAPTTLPPETETTETSPETVPDGGDGSVTMPPSDWQKENIEEKFGVETYSSPGYFLLKDPGLEIGFQDGSPVTLNLPESWAGKYYVIEIIYGIHAGGYDPTERIWDICVVSKDVLQTYWKVFDFRSFDYALVLHRMLIDEYESTLEWREEQGITTGGAVVAQDDQYVYIVDTYETAGGDGFFAASRENLLSKISEEEYLKAQGDITCTLEEAVAMCSVDPEE